MQEVIEKILSIPVGKVLGYYGFPVRGRGKEHRILCPFHDETRPSFFIIHNKNFCYCFGCSKSWDSIGLIREFDQCSFLDALQKLCEISGWRKLVGVDLKGIFEGFKRVRIETFSDQQSYAYARFISRVEQEFYEYYKSFSNWKSFNHIISYFWLEFDQLNRGKSSQRIFDQVKDWFHEAKREVKNAHIHWRKFPGFKREAWFDRVHFKI